MLEVLPKWIIRLLSKRHAILPYERGFMDWENFFQETLTKFSQDKMESTATLLGHFFAKSLSMNGINLNLMSSSPNRAILIIKHTYFKFSYEEICILGL